MPRNLTVYHFFVELCIGYQSGIGYVESPRDLNDQLSTADMARCLYSYCKSLQIFSRFRQFVERGTCKNGFCNTRRDLDILLRPNR